MLLLFGVSLLTHLHSYTQCVVCPGVVHLQFIRSVYRGDSNSFFSCLSSIGFSGDKNINYKRISIKLGLILLLSSSSQLILYVSYSFSLGGGGGKRDPSSFFDKTLDEP